MLLLMVIAVAFCVLGAAAAGMYLLDRAVDPGKRQP
jgi:hypothetical protein